MDERMTLEKIRDHHLGKVAYYTDENYPRMKQLHQQIADVIDSHLTQPAQAVDVQAIKEVVIWLRTRSSETVSYRVGMDQASKLTRAIGNAQAEGWKELEAEARRLYNASVGDAHNLHCLAWSELSKDQQRKWISKTALTQATPNAHE